jgi:hypothetical protein
MSEYSEDIKMIWNDDGFNELGFPSCRGVGTISDIAWEPHVNQKSDIGSSSYHYSKIPWSPTLILPATAETELADKEWSKWVKYAHRPRTVPRVNNLTKFLEGLGL